MDALSLIQSFVSDEARTYDVLTKDDGGVYDDGYTQDGEIEVAIFAPSSTAQLVVEGADQDTSLTGLVVPQDDSTPPVNVTDRLRLQSNEAKLYDVHVVDGVPNDLDPELWQLGLEPANQSQ